MKKILIISLFMAFLFGTAFLLIKTDNETAAATEAVSEWSMNATAIEACTCPMFCQCYLNTEPAAHSHGHGHMDGEEGDSEHYCKFNMAWMVNEGHYGDIDLEGAVFWIAGDLGEGWEDGNVDWATLHFDPAVSDEKREGIAEIPPSLFPANWSSFGVEEDKPIYCPVR